MLKATALMLAIPLLIRCYIGTLARFTSDDFCWSMVISERGFLGLQTYLYEACYGRLASSLLLGSMSYLGAATAPILPVVTVILCIASMAWFGYEISDKLTLSIIFSEILIIAVLTTAPKAAIEPLYWQSALLTYLPPFFLGPIGAALAVRYKSSLAAGFTAFLVCQFNEAASLLVVSLLFILMPFVGPGRRRLMIAALIGGVLSTAVVAASPGNALRHNDPNPTDYGRVFVDTVLTGKRLLIPIVTSYSGVLLFVLGAILASYLQLKRRKKFFLAAFISLLLAIPPIAASVYGIKTLMARTAIIPTFPLVAAVLFLGLGIGSFFVVRNRVIVLASAVLFVIATGHHAMSVLPIMQEFNQAWDAQHELLSASSPDAQISIIPSPNPFHDSWQVRSDKNWIINQCVATFYNVKSVQLSEDQ